MGGPATAGATGLEWWIQARTARPYRERRGHAVRPAWPRRKLGTWHIRSAPAHETAGHDAHLRHDGSSVWGRTASAHEPNASLRLRKPSLDAANACMCPGYLGRWHSPQVCQRERSPTATKPTKPPPRSLRGLQRRLWDAHPSPRQAW